MGGRGGSYSNSETVLRARADEIHSRNRQRQNRYNQKPDPEMMETSAIYREIDKTTNKIERTYNQPQVDSFKKNYNNARSKFNKGDIAGAERLLAKVPQDYVRFRALDEYMYGSPSNEKHVKFYKQYH